MPPRPRTPSPEEAALLTVYRDAERYLLETIRGEVVDVADLADAGADTDARRVVGARRVREAVESTVLGLERGALARVERIVGAAAEQGVDAATRELGALSGRGAAGDYGDTINRGALDRLAASTVTLMTQAHQSVLRTVPDAFRDAVARTVSGVLVGAQTRREAAQRAMWNLTDRGVTSFTDRRGRRWRLSSYVEMATRTAAARAEVDAQLDRLRAVGQGFVQVSNAPRECDRCRRWEGKVLANGDGPVGRVEVEHGIEDGRTVTIDVAGTVEQARTAGLLHPNCRHSLSLYMPGVTPPLDVTRDPGGYQAGQRQREIERHIRAWKEREAAAVTPAARRAAAAKVKGWQGAMREHLREHPDLKRLSYREGIGAGNLPTQALRERLGGDGPVAPAVRGRERTPRQMSDPELERKMNASLREERFDDFERFADETDRRDQARVAARERRAADRERREQERAEEYDRLLDKGYSDEQAVEEAFGIPVERQRRDAAAASLRADGYRGTWREITRAAYRDELEREYLRAEEVARGGSMMRRGAPARVRTEQLFTGNEEFARKWASEELLAWWDENGRLTYDAFVDRIVNGRGIGRGRGGDFLQ